MRTLFRSIAAILLFAAAARPADAGELQLTIANGRVTLIAQDVPVRQILAEWARIGQTRIVNGEKLTGPAVTLHIVDKPEREVLETLLRSASGYVASPRTTASSGPSAFEAVMIMPTSRPPAVTASAPPSFNQRPGYPQMPPQMQPQPQPMMPTDDDEDGEPSDQGVVPPPGVLPPGAVAMPQPGVQPQVQPYPGMMQPGVIQQPGLVPQPGQQVPQTAPRPGMPLPAPQAVPGNPYQPPQQPAQRPPGGPGDQGL